MSCSIAASHEGATMWKQQLAMEEGLHFGFTSAANVCAATKMLSSGALAPNATVATVLLRHWSQVLINGPLAEGMRSKTFAKRDGRSGSTCCVSTDSKRWRCTIGIDGRHNPGTRRQGLTGYY